MREVMALIALALLSATTHARDLIDRYGGGGTLRSPDGRWTVTAPPSPGPDDRYAPAPAYLRGPGVRRHLLDYGRLLDAHWAQDGHHVLLTLIDLDGEQLDVRTLGHAKAGNRNGLGR